VSCPFHWFIYFSLRVSVQLLPWRPGLSQRGALDALNAGGIGDGGPKGEAKGRVTQADSRRDSVEPASGVPLPSSCRHFSLLPRNLDLHEAMLSYHRHYLPQPGIKVVLQQRGPWALQIAIRKCFRIRRANHF
jgi:hypothetical protein